MMSEYLSTAELFGQNKSTIGSGIWVSSLTALVCVYCFSTNDGNVGLALNE